uniref:Uncharacterized protein n=1 Tax=Alexandrium monilatum TaxID=311494 RepID=A0A7S4T3U2_9DINO
MAQAILDQALWVASCCRGFRSSSRGHPQPRPTSIRGTHNQSARQAKTMACRLAALLAIAASVQATLRYASITSEKAAAEHEAVTANATISQGAQIAPFGKEDTARELQTHAARTQDTLVDAVENAEVAEIKRAVFRALTRLRAATIKEFDTIARLETQAIDAYNDAHHYRAENPLAHLHEDEAPVETDKLKSFH